VKRLALLLILCVSVSFAHAQTGPNLSVTNYLSHDKLLPGAVFRVAVVLDVPAPWHVNANPAGDAFLIPTTLTWQPPGNVTIARVTYPLGKTIKVEWSDKPIGLYAGRVTIFTEARLSPDTPPGPLSIPGQLRYQACDDQTCLPPATLPVTLRAEVAAPPATPQPQHPEIFGAAPTDATDTPAADGSIESLLQRRGWWLTVLLVFLGGLGLNLTPCVYPMITITVSYFGAQQGRTRRQAFVGALVYCTGIVISYTVLGVVAAWTGGLFGALLQSKWVLLGIAGLLVVLALSTFGLFEIRPPQFLVQRATGLSGHSGQLGVFFLGATMGLIAAPCLAPFAVALLAYVSATGQWWWFAIFATGLALPYLVLGTFSGLLARLPRSGTWMVWVKRVFGTALLAAAVWFAWPVLGPKGKPASPINWQTYAPSLIEAPGQPVVLDFYADWCIPCHELDRKTFSDPRVVAAAKDFRMLRADLTITDSPAVEALRKQFDIRTVPTIVFLGPDGRERRDLRVVSFIPPDELLRRMSALHGQR